MKKRRDQNSRLRFLKLQTRWLRQDLRQPNPYSGRARIKKWISENLKEIESLKQALK